MSESAPPTREFPPQVSALLATMQSLIDNPPAGFSHSEYEPGVILSDQHIPGYTHEPTHSIKVGVSNIIIGRVELPGLPQDNGAPTMRNYDVYSDGWVQLWQYQFPHPDRIRKIEKEILAMVPPSTDLELLRNMLVYGITDAVRDHLNSRNREKLALPVSINMAEVEALNLELVALAQNGIS